MNNNLNNFKNKDNLNLLWDVLLDELHINKTNINLTNNIRTVFESNVSPFTNRINPKFNLIELNKQFLSQVVLAVNKLFPNLKQDQIIKRINISNEEVTEPYKIEDIQANRLNEFEREVERKKIELENFMTPVKPKELDFSDKQLDGSIKAIDSLVVEKITQRNLEIEQIQNLNYNSKDINPELWLKPKETSIKNEKINLDPKPIIKSNENSRLKYFSMDNNNNIVLNISETDNKSHNNEKKVSWEDEDKTLEPTINIFNKLKKQENLKFDALRSNSNIEISEKQYVEQKSMELPELKKEEIIKNQPIQIMSNNDPILPKTEIIKQLNELNNKINTIEEIITNNSIKEKFEELNNKISNIEENLNNSKKTFEDYNEITINKNNEFSEINVKIDNLNNLIVKIVYFLENLYKINLHNNS